jgi:voltage-gated potassium channel
VIRTFVLAHIDLVMELAGALALLAAIIVACGVAMARADKTSVEDGIYLAFITAFTVGFGDITPKSRTTRIVSVILAFIGLLLVGIVVAVAVHALDIALEAHRGS